MTLIISIVFFLFLAVIAYAVFLKIKDSFWYRTQQVRRAASQKEKERAALIASQKDLTTEEEKQEFVLKLQGKQEAVKIPYASFDYIYRHIDDFGVIDKNGNIVIVSEDAYRKITSTSNYKKFLPSEQKEEPSVGEKNVPSNYFEIEISDDGTTIERNHIVNSEVIETKDKTKYTFQNRKMVSVEHEEDKTNGKGKGKGKKCFTGEYEPFSENEPNQTKNLPALVSDIKKQNEYIKELENDRRLLTDKAYRDHMTRANNKAKYSEDIKTLDAKECIFAFIDGDHFKNVNDTYGHDAGNEIIKMLANNIFAKIRDKNMTEYRFGGEEFVIISKETTEETLSILEHLRTSIEADRVVNRGNTIKITISIGVAHGKYFDNVSDAVDAADTMVYLSKDNGRNQINVYDPKIHDLEELRKVEKEIENEHSPKEPQNTANKDKNKKKDDAKVNIHEELKRSLAEQAKANNATSTVEETITEQEEEKTEEPTQSTFLGFESFLGQLDGGFIDEFLRSIIISTEIVEQPVLLFDGECLYVDNVYFIYILISMADESIKKDLFNHLFKGSENHFLQHQNVLKIVSSFNSVAFSQISSELIATWGEDQFIVKKYFMHNGKKYTNSMFKLYKDGVESFNIALTDVEYVEFLSNQDANGCFNIGRKTFKTLFSNV